MKTLKEYSISDGEWIRYHSKLCGVAASIHFPHSTDFAGYITELSFSYLNQWQFVMDSYQELEQKLRELNTFSTTPLPGSPFSPYDLQSVQIETGCRDYVYLMITSMKSLLDLLACLVEATVNQTVREENQMVDIRSIDRRMNIAHAQPVLDVMQSFLNKDLYPWIGMIKLLRDRLIHRGYCIKPSFGFQKSDELKVNLYKGNGSDETTIAIGELFAHFVGDLPLMESKVSDALLACVPELSDGQTVEMHYKTSGGFTEYHYNAIKDV